MNNVVNAVGATGLASAAAGGTQATAPHWTEQSASREDKTQMAQLVNSAPAQKSAQPAAIEHADTSSRTALRLSSLHLGTNGDALGRAELFAALDKLRNTPAERMPVAAAELMVKCYEYQFNVSAVTHAAKNVEDSVQTMTTRS